MRVQVHYVIGALIFTLYGAKVCPFLDSLTSVQLAVPIVIGFAVAFAIRLIFERKVIIGRPVMTQVASQWRIELSLFFMVGIVLAVFNTVYYNFPVGSGAKVVIGTLILGSFIATDLALNKNRLIVDHMTEIAGFFPNPGFWKLSRKLAAYGSGTVLAIGVILFLVITKDLNWLVQEIETRGVMAAAISVLKEFIFVSVVVVGYLLVIVFSYAKLLEGFFSRETHALQLAANGDFSAQVPPVSHDEFGVMANYTNKMILGLKERDEELSRTQAVTIQTLASLAETRDNETGSHILRTQRYVRELAQHVSKISEYGEKLSPQVISLLYQSAPLHDIGKVGIPDHILLKPGRHTSEEFEIMKTHAELGAKALQGAEESLGSNYFLKFAKEIALTHHEKWDGSGYPKGIKEQDIPLAGRLMAIADVYDALISKRVYKPAFSHEKAVSIILEGKGTHFDPLLIDIFDEIQEKFKEIAKQFSDSH